jgi:hypothetical protein
MLGTIEERQAIAEGLAKTRGQAWAIASEELRNCEIDGAIRQREMADHLQGRSFVQQPVSESSSAPAPVLEETGDPCESLKSSLDDLARAEAARDEAGEVVDRALQRLARAEGDAAEYEGLEAKIDAWHIAETRGGRVGDMPYSLIAAARERSAAIDRLEHANRAHRALALELKDAERRVQELQRAASVAAQRIVLKRAEERAADLQNLMDEADEIRAELEALAGCAFPNAGGLVQVSPPILAALNRPSRERGQHTQAVLELHKRHWQSMHKELLADPEA